MTDTAATAKQGGARRTAVRCPRCGGAPDPKGGPGHLARCSSCGVLGRIEDPDGGQRRYVVHPSVDATFASRAVRQAVAEREGAGDRAEDVRILDSELLLVPYWRIRTVVVGRIEGTRERRDKTLEKVTNDNGQTFYAWRVRDSGVEKVDRELEKVHIAVVTACPLDELGLPTLGSHRQTGLGLPLHKPLETLGSVSLFDATARDGAEVLDPLVGRPQAEREAAALVEAYRSGLGSGMTGAARVETVILDRNVLLVFYPLFHVRVRAGERQGAALVDAARGEVTALDLPARASSVPTHRTHPATMLALAFAAGAIARGVLPAVDAVSVTTAGFVMAGLSGGAFWLYDRMTDVRGGAGNRA